MMKRRISAILIMIICLSFAACDTQKSQPDVQMDLADEIDEEKETGEAEKTDQVDETGKEKENEKLEVTEEANQDSENEADKANNEDPSLNKARYAAYKELLLDLYKNNHLAEWGDIDFIDSESMSDNQFAIADVDKDGKEELIVYVTSTIVAGHAGIIYDFNEETGKVYAQLKEYPLLSFYENGAVEAGWSHNQGKAGDFWPYTLYVYDKESDSYKEAGYVDAYDRALYEQNKDVFKDDPFPYDVDKDGNGFVYYLYSAENKLADYQKIAPVDDDAYLSWLQNYTNGSKKIDITFYNLTEENINSILDK